jgi:hypothetical protein
MIRKFYELPFNIRLFIVLAVILIIGIILRWNYIKHEASQSFRFFKRDNDTVVCAFEFLYRSPLQTHNDI